MKRLLLALLTFIPAVLVAGLAAYFGAYAGLATATHWQQAVAACVFVIALAGWMVLAGDLLMPARLGRAAPVPARLAFAAVAVLAASALWLFLFWS